MINSNVNFNRTIYFSFYIYLFSPHVSFYNVFDRRRWGNIRQLYSICPSCAGRSPSDFLKLLGVIVQDTFSVDMHVNYILSICSQRVFLLQRLRDQGLPVKHLNTVFQALMVSRLLYALPSWGCFSQLNFLVKLMLSWGQHIIMAYQLIF